MLNEFVYCRRLFYYEFVEGVFVESADTLRGAAIHERVDTGSGALPAAKKRVEAAKPSSTPENAKSAEGRAAKPKAEGEGSETQNAEAETIHSRSVQMGSERLGVVAKMDLVEGQAERAAEVANGGEGPREQRDLFTALEVRP
ncbi:MAG: hypothetical protein ACLQM8_09785, partial [Limisphaerales bacterium]